jgi:hypothetical protein
MKSFKLISLVQPREAYRGYKNHKLRDGSQNMSKLYEQVGLYELGIPIQEYIIFNTSILLSCSKYLECNYI